jgi:hypothetical protein
MSEEIPLYDLQEELTNGWFTVNEGKNLNKEDCTNLYNTLLRQGVNPRRLKIVRVA